MDCIKQVILQIKRGYLFDSHFIIDCLIKEHTDSYLNFCAAFQGNNITFKAHQQIGQQIAKLEGDIVERQSAQSWSTNIHNNGSECALWKRI